MGVTYTTCSLFPCVTHHHPSPAPVWRGQCHCDETWIREIDFRCSLPVVTLCPSESLSKLRDYFRTECPSTGLGPSAVYGKQELSFSILHLSKHNYLRLQWISHLDWVSLLGNYEVPSHKDRVRERRGICTRVAKAQEVRIG